MKPSSADALPESAAVVLAAAGVGALGGGRDQQPAAVGGQRAVDDLDLAAEVDRRRRAGRVGLAPGLGLLARGIAAGAVILEGFDQA